MHRLFKLSQPAINVIKNTAQPYFKFRSKILPPFDPVKVAKESIQYGGSIGSLIAMGAAVSYEAHEIYKKEDDKEVIEKLLFAALYSGCWGAGLGAVGLTLARWSIMLPELPLAVGAATLLKKTYDAQQISEEKTSTMKPGR